MFARKGPVRTPLRDRGNQPAKSTFEMKTWCFARVMKMKFFRKADRIHWNQLQLDEQIVMFAMTTGPQMNAEWPIQRALCYYRVAEITPFGLRMTRFGRQVMAERHGLPVVVGREPAPETRAEISN